MPRRKKAPKRVLWLVQEEPDEIAYLTDSPVGGDVVLRKRMKESDLTLEKMADFLDNECTGVNAHDFVPAHRALAALLFQEVGRETAIRIFRRLVNLHGLAGLVGSVGMGDVKVSEADLGVPLESGSEAWSLPEAAGGSGRDGS